MKREALILAVLVCFLSGVVNLVELAAETKKDVHKFKDTSENSKVLVRDMLKSSEYKQALREARQAGPKGPAARGKVRVYPKQAYATDVIIKPGMDPSASIKVGAVFVDLGKALEGQPTPLGIIMVGRGDGKYHALRLTSTLEPGDAPMASLVDMNGKVVLDSSVSILKKSPLKIVPNGAKVVSDSEDVLVLLSNKRTGEVYTLVIPAEVFVKIFGRLQESEEGN
jgi:hypothetical protein